MSENTLYPNTFQHHNAYIDQVQFFLTGNEEKVLNRIIREIMGWEKGRQTLTTTVSLSVLADGKISKETGKRLSYGCGLTGATIRKILKTLCELGLIERLGKATYDGQTYRLQLDWEKINWDKMQARKETKDTCHQEQTETARKLLANRGGWDEHFKQRVMERDRGICRYCGASAVGIDHIIPTSRGGTNTIENCVAACCTCNSKKGAMTPEEAGMKIAPIGVLLNSTPIVEQVVTPIVEQVVTPIVEQYPINPSSKPISKPNKTKEGERKNTLAPPPCLSNQFSLSVKAILKRKHTGTEWRAIQDAEKDREKPRKSLIRGIETKLTGGGHPAVRIYQEEMGHYPRKNQIKDITAVVGENGRLEEWRIIVNTWKMSGWNPYNLKDMLKCFREHKVPGQDRRRGGPGGRPPPDIPDASYFREQMRQEQLRPAHPEPEVFLGPPSGPTICDLCGRRWAERPLQCPDCRTDDWLRPLTEAERLPV